MNIFKILQARSRLFYFMLFSLGMIRSLTNIGILMLVNQMLGGKRALDFDKYNYLLFILFILISFFCTLLFQNYMVNLTADIMFKQELSMVEKVRHSSYESFLKVGKEKIYSAISDTRLLAQVPQTFVAFLNSLITVVCAMIYLMWVSTFALVFVLAVILCLFMLYRYQTRQMKKGLDEVRNLQDSFWSLLIDLLQGFKQIRISAVRNATLYNKYIIANRVKSRGLTIGVSRMQMANELT